MLNFVAGVVSMFFVTAGADPGAAATVNGEIISVEDYVQYSVQMGGYAILMRMVNDQLLQQEAKRRGIEITEDDIQREVFKSCKRFPNEESLKKYLEAAHMTEKDLRHDAVREAIISKMIAPSVEIKEEDIKAFFERNPKQFMKKRQYKFKEICVNTEEEINEISKKLTEGASFEDLARQKSILPSASKGGDSDWVEEGERGYITERGFRDLQPGQVSLPIRAPDGFHVFLYEGVREPESRGYEEVRAQVQEAYRQQMVGEKMRQLLEKLRETAQIDVQLWKAQ